MRGLIEWVDTVITPPAQPAVTLDYARRHLKSLTHEDDVLIANWIAAATSYIEEQTGRQLITATREVWLDTFWGTSIILPRPPLQSVVSVQYLDNDVLTPFSDGGSPETPYYTVFAPVGDYARPGWIEASTGYSWPTVVPTHGGVRIRYTCGYGDTPTDIPPLLTGAICYLVALFDQERSLVTRTGAIELPFGMQQLIDGFKYSSLRTLSTHRHWNTWPHHWTTTWP